MEKFLNKTFEVELLLLSKLGILVSEKRKQQKLSLEELSEASIVSTNIIHDLENGKSMPKVRTLIKLCLTLGITPEEILELFQKKEGAHTSLALLLPEYGYTTDEIVKIMEYIGYVEYKKTDKEG